MATLGKQFNSLTAAMRRATCISGHVANRVTINSSEDINLHLHQSQHAHHQKHFSSVYDDPFSDVVSGLDHPIPTSDPAQPPQPQQQQQATDPDAPSIDRDHKLLSFSPPTQDCTLLDYTYRQASLSLTAQLHGMFFLAESPWAAAGDAQAPPSELTCYRRNLFQITGELHLPRGLRYVVTEQGEHIPILGQELVVSATESTEGNPVKIISVPWKTPANPGAPAPAEDKVEREPPSIPLDLVAAAATGQGDADADTVSFPFQWKRLQFRIATANNGRRKELQQHFIVRLRVVATLATGGTMTLAEAQSGAVIVRGRSPRNFQSRKDLPLNGSGSMRRTSSHITAPAEPSRSSAASESARRGAPSLPDLHVVTSMPAISSAPPPSSHTFFSPTTDHDFFDWPPPQETVPRASYPMAADVIYPSKSPHMQRAARLTPLTLPVAPINLSLVEDESPRSDRGIATPPDTTHVRPAKRQQTDAPGVLARAPSFSLTGIGSPDESADLLYEYFPLCIDDWKPPVEAVYRPHVVHHTKLPYDSHDPRATTKTGRSKRYFIEDVV